MPVMKPIVRRAIPGDAARLSELAASTFHDAFAEGNSPDDMARYMAMAFTPARQADEIADPDSTILLAELAGPGPASELVGYAHLVSGNAPDAVTGPAPIELKRLYVARAWHGQRVAQARMDAIMDAAREQGAKTLWLGVWKKNARAAAFYEKYGFARVGEHEFVLGTDVQTDWVLSRSL